MEHDFESNKSEVIAAITAAFRDVRLGDGISMQQARAIDDWGGPDSIDPLEARMKDKESRWWEIPDNKLKEFHDAVPFLCPIGYRFYIPAYMIWKLRHQCLNDEHSGLDTSTMYSFNPHDPTETVYEGQRERFQLLNKSQKQAVCRFLEYVAISDPGWAGDVTEYLSKYWCAFHVDP